MQPRWLETGSGHMSFTAHPEIILRILRFNFPHADESLIQTPLYMIASALPKTPGKIILSLFTWTWSPEEADGGPFLVRMPKLQDPLLEYLISFALFLPPN